MPDATGWPIERLTEPERQWLQTLIYAALEERRRILPPRLVLLTQADKRLLIELAGKIGGMGKVLMVATTVAGDNRQD
jgi:hypothetical protein